MLGMGILMGGVYSCDTECSFDNAQLAVVEEASGTNVMTINGPICPENTAVVEQDENYFVLAVVEESAASFSLDPYEAFEEGKQITSPLTGINESSRHIFEVRDKSTLKNNINHPYFTSIDNTSEGKLLSYTGKVELNGHELMLMLPLMDIDDKGGAKTWQVSEVTTTDGNPVPNIDDWACFLDNKYSFLKGQRMRYDPNGDDDTGLLCAQELDYFTDPSSVSNVYGTYAVDDSGTDLMIKTHINMSINEVYEVSFKVVSYDWNELKVEAENGLGQKAIAILTPFEYIDNI